MPDSAIPSRFRARGSIGTLIGISGVPLTEMISALGFDFLFLDLEHGEIADRDLPVQVMASRVPVLARIPEGSETAADIEGICGTPGISSVFVGPFDLSAALGGSGDFEEAAFTSAISDIVFAAHAAGLPAGVFAPSVAAWARFRERGFDYAVLRSDSLFLADGATAALAEARSGEWAG